MRLAPPVAVLAVALFLAPAAGAHGAPAPRDMDTRVLADQNDDCGGDDAGSLSNCRGTHDLIALDVREAHDGTQDVLVFRLFLNGGDPEAGLRDVVHFRAGGADRSFEVTTADNRAFGGSGAGFLHASAAQPVNDGTRFAVEATLRRDALGVGPGDRLTALRAEAFQGDTAGDIMPGSYKTALGTDGPTSPSEQADPQTFIRDYPLEGPVQYASLSGPAQARLVPGREEILRLQVRNLLGDAPQTLTLEVEGADGVEASFHAGADPEGPYGPTARLALARAGAAGSESTVHLALEGARGGASGTLTLVLATDLGGRVTLDLPYQVAAGASSGGPKVTPPEGDGEGIPSPGPVAALAVLSAMALWLRRRSGP